LTKENNDLKGALEGAQGDYELLQNRAREVAIELKQRRKDVEELKMQLEESANSSSKNSVTVMEMEGVVKGMKEKGEKDRVRLGELESENERLLNNVQTLER